VNSGPFFPQKSFENVLKFYLVFRLKKGNIHQKENTIHDFYFFTKNRLKTCWNYIYSGWKRGIFTKKRKHYSCFFLSFFFSKKSFENMFKNYIYNSGWKKGNNSLKKKKKTLFMILIFFPKNPLKTCWNHIYYSGWKKKSKLKIRIKN
jgi:hypothetical protein